MQEQASSARDAFSDKLTSRTPNVRPESSAAAAFAMPAITQSGLPRPSVASFSARRLPGLDSLNPSDLPFPLTCCFLQQRPALKTGRCFSEVNRGNAKPRQRRRPSRFRLDGSRQRFAAQPCPTNRLRPLRFRQASQRQYARGDHFRQDVASCVGPRPARERNRWNRFRPTRTILMFQWARKLLGGTRPAQAVQQPRVQARFDNALANDENARYWSMVDYLSAKAANTFQVRRTLRVRSRYEASNNPYLYGISTSNADDLVSTGPTLKCLLKNESNNREIESLWRDWADEVQLVEKLRTLKLAKTVDGEGFLTLKTVRH